MFSLTTAEEKQNSETEMKRNACEREYKRGELLSDSCFGFAGIHEI